MRVASALAASSLLTVAAPLQAASYSDISSPAVSTPVASTTVDDGTRTTLLPAAEPMSRADCAPPGRSWTAHPVRTVSTGLGLLGQPDLVVASSGQATTAWNGRPEKYGPTVIRSADDPATAGDPRSPTAGALVSAHFPAPNFQIGQDASGVQTLMWYQERMTPDGEFTDRYALALATRTGNGDWSTPPAEVVHRFIVNPQLAVNAAGAAVVVWGQFPRGGGDPHVYASYRPVGRGDWSAAEKVPDAQSIAFHVGIDDAGNALVVYDKSGQTVVKAVRRPPGGAWGTPRQISGPRSFDSTMAVSAGGGAVVAWKRLDSEDHVDAHFTARMTSGGKWRSPVQRAEGMGIPLRGLDVDSRGRALAAWWVGTNLMAMWSRSDGTWRSPFVLAASQQNPERPRLKVAVNRRGDALVVWRTGGDSDPRLRARYRPAGGAWSNAARLTPHGVTPGLYGIAIGDCGHTAVSWTTDNRLVQIRRTSPALESGRAP